MPQAQYTVSSAIHISGSNWRITEPKWSECFGVLDTMFALFSRSPETRERPDSSRKEPCLPGSRILVVGRRSYASSWLGVIATLVVMPFVGWLYLRLGYAASAPMLDLPGSNRHLRSQHWKPLRHATRPSRTIRFSRPKLTLSMVQGFTGTNAPIVELSAAEAVEARAS